MIIMDLSSLSSIRAAAKEFLAQLSSLHILICNAGIMAVKYRLNDDGVDMQFATNHIGHFLLFQLLKDVMVASAPSRLVVVSGNAAYDFGDASKGIDYSRLPSVNESSYSRFGAYRQSKLANVLFALEVNRRYSRRGLTAYSLHPGGIRTGLQDEVGGNSILFRFFFWITSPLWKTMEQGAATTIYWAITPGIEEHGGQYFDNSRVTERVTSNIIPDGEAEKLWRWTEEFIDKHNEEPHNS